MSSRSTTTKPTSVPAGSIIFQSQFISNSYHCVLYFLKVVEGNTRQVSDSAWRGKLLECVDGKPTETARAFHDFHEHFAIRMKIASTIGWKSGIWWNGPTVRVIEAPWDLQVNIWVLALISFELMQKRMSSRATVRSHGSHRNWPISYTMCTKSAALP